jgi:hypothetical protein
MKQVAFLGYIILKGGISVDPSKVQDVSSWNAPTSVSDILSYPIPRKRERSLHTCAQDVQITHIVTI